MASTTFTKDTGCNAFLSLLLLGVLLPSVLVSGESTTVSGTSIASASATSSLAATSGATAPASVSTGATATQPLTMTAIGSTAVPTIAITGGSTASTTTTTTTTTTTQSTTSTASTTSGASPSTMAQSSSTTPTSTSTSTSGSSSTVMSTSWPSNITGVTSGMNATTSMSMINCPTFTCNQSECYMMYVGRNDTPCETGEYCQLMRQTDMCYTVGCTPSCNVSCTNASQDNCSVNCCNFTGCLNASFSSMMMTTTTVTTTTITSTTPVTTTTATSPPTSANNGNKCHKGTCTGTTCYTDFGSRPREWCSSSQPHCQLKKETMNADLQWTAGCTTNCSEETQCKETTKPPCHLECCNATTTSCLWLNGTLNVPSSATRGPHIITESITALLCLLAISLFL